MLHRAHKASGRAPAGRAGQPGGSGTGLRVHPGQQPGAGHQVVLQQEEQPGLPVDPAPEAAGPRHVQGKAGSRV